MSKTALIENNIFTFFETIDFLEKRLVTELNKSIYVYAVSNEAGLVNLYIINETLNRPKKIMFTDETSFLASCKDNDIDELIVIEGIKASEFIKILNVCNRKYFINNFTMPSDVKKPVLHLYGGDVSRVSMHIAYQTDILSETENEEQRRTRFKTAFNKTLSIHNVSRFTEQAEQDYRVVYEQIYGTESSIRTLKSKASEN